MDNTNNVNEAVICYNEENGQEKPDIEVVGPSMQEEEKTRTRVLKDSGVIVESSNENYVVRMNDRPLFTFEPPNDLEEINVELKAVSYKRRWLIAFRLNGKVVYYIQPKDGHFWSGTINQRRK